MCADTIKLNQKKALMIAHRGLSGIEKENTNAAFLAAGNRSYFGIESDVRKTADGQYVMHHDAVISNTVNGLFDRKVEECTYDEIKDLVLAERDGSTDRRDLKIPTLQEYISICRKYDKKAVLELKGIFDKSEVQEILEIIKKENYLDGVVFISFKAENCIIVRELLPEQPIQWLTDDAPTEDDMKMLCKYQFDLDIYYRNLRAEDVVKLHENNLKVNCWCADTQEDAKRVIDMGVDFITSNILE